MKNFKCISRKLLRCTMPAFTLALVASSCNSEGNEGTTPQDELIPVTITINNYRQTSLDDITYEGGETRAAGNVSVLAHLALAVYDTNGKLYTSIEQEKGENDYGTFKLNVPKGKYSFVCIGYDGTHAVQLSNCTNITFADNYVPNCFYYTLTTTVDDATSINKQVDLARCVSCFTLRCSSGIPDDMSTMSYTTTGGSLGFNALTGYAASAVTRTDAIDVSGVTNRQSSITMNVYSFLTSEECDMNYTFEAKKQDGTVLRSRTFKDVPMKTNQRTFYTGDFFADNTAFSVTLANVDWDVIEKTF